MRLLLIMAWSLLFSSSAFTNSEGSNRTETVRIEYDISVDGPAIFYRIHNAKRKEVWRVDCMRPLRNCIARSNGLVLSLDANAKPWIIAARRPNSRVSIQVRNYAIDIPDLLNRPLSESEVAYLSSDHSFIVIESDAEVLLRAATTGLDQLVSYLLWIRSPQALTVRDARLWTDFKASELGKARLSTEVLASNKLQLLRRNEVNDRYIRHQIPATKPQVEFAIKSQKGASFYSASGRAGY
ncbi:MAG: hypothetical protein JXQ85_13805 [Cognatishimia sp.]|uniref:hypothetical protein n=1 Tax=Cognatishimia sp. TaxID=2211648 RepID=UPI003B8B638D